MFSNWIAHWTRRIRGWYYSHVAKFDVYSSDLPLGKRGEQYAARQLQIKGYEIVRTNWKNGQYELDIIAQDGDTLVFVEVKTRADNSINEPERNVTPEKQRRVAEASRSFVYLNRYGLRLTKFRIDVIGIVWPNEQSRPTIFRHWENCIPLDFTSPVPDSVSKSRYKHLSRKKDEFTVRM